MGKKLGVAIIGVNGAVSSTVIAGTELMVRGLTPRIGMLTEKSDVAGESPISEAFDYAPLEDLVFGGWDLQFPNLYEATLTHQVLPKEKLDAIRPTLENAKPWPAVFSQEYAVNLRGDNIVTVNGMRAQVEHIMNDLKKFQKDHNLDNVVMVNLASTEKYMELQKVHTTPEAFEEGLDKNDPAIAPAMRYFYAAIKCGFPHANFAPSLSNIPALAKLAEQHGVPYAGMDGKTGQTLLKTALAAMFRVRQLKVHGWYSINFLGNNDGLVLDSPSSNKTKVLSKASVLDSIVGYHVENHQVHIHYYKPRGDAKEAWDNIDLVGFGGVPMQMKINFLCQDSVLAAPLVIDLIRLLDEAKKVGEKGIQRQLSVYFKSPYASPGETPVHDLFRQEKLLLDWVAAKSSKTAK
ncbi:MAG: inositol-3-phosphate synthase [Polyangiaceae bacterium]|nr:inositol-3-phosphate synthase [Polyangiaceae bacterium]